MNASTTATRTNHATSTHAGAGGCASHTQATPSTTYTAPLAAPTTFNLTTTLVCRWGRSRRRACGGRWAWRRRYVGSLPRVGVGAAWVAGLADSLQEELADAAARNVSAVIRADLARDHDSGLPPHRRPGVGFVVLLEERLPHRDADVLAEQLRGRTLPA